jgi:C4-dicarboxylate-specific signal transduction histidine kinase
LEGIIDEELPLLTQLLPKNTQVHFSHGNEPTPVYGSRRAIAEILLHVVGNAGESLSKQNAAIWITIQKHGEESAVSIRDNGHGISPEIQDRLFEPFSTTRSATGHAGLGLYRARMLARQMGGELSLSNHYEAGAEAVLTLPQSAPDTAP